MNVDKTVVEKFFQDGGTYFDCLSAGVCYQSAKNARITGRCSPESAVYLADLLGVDFFDFVQVPPYAAHMVYNRVTRGYGQEELCKIAGCGVNAVNRAEAGVTVPKPHTLKKLADVLGLTVKEYIGETGEAE